jgi:hypothetical protein
VAKAAVKAATVAATGVGAGGIASRASAWTQRAKRLSVPTQVSRALRPLGTACAPNNVLNVASVESAAIGVNAATAVPDVVVKPVAMRSMREPKAALRSSPMAKTA